jgi:hypothetical protein
VSLRAGSSGISFAKVTRRRNSSGVSVAWRLVPPAVTADSIAE